MSQDSSTIRLTLRLPENIRDKLLTQADKNSRSMNGEIIAVLGNAMKADGNIQDRNAPYRLSENQKTADLPKLLESLSTKQKKQLAALIESLLEQGML